jgi:hypothetical protein
MVITYTTSNGSYTVFSAETVETTQGDGISGKDERTLLQGNTIGESSKAWEKNRSMPLCHHELRKGMDHAALAKACTLWLRLHET